MKFEVTEITKATDLKEMQYLQEYSQILKSVYQNPLKCFTLKDKGQNPVAFFCIYSFNKLWQKHIITPPFLTDIQLTSFGLASNFSQINNFNRDVISTVASFLKKQSHSYMEIVLPKDVKDALPFIWNDFKVGIRYTYYLDLSLKEEELIQNMSSQRRKNIRDAEKLDLKVKEISDPKLIFSKANETLSSKSAKFNEEIVRQLAELACTENLVTIGIYEKDNLVALSSCLITPSEAIYLFGWNTNEQGQSFIGTYALWNCILACKSRSSSFNFAGSQIPSIEKYFRGFGGTLTPLISVISDKRKLTKQFT